MQNVANAGLLNVQLLLSHSKYFFSLYTNPYVGDLLTVTGAGSLASGPWNAVPHTMQNFASTSLKYSHATFEQWIVADEFE